MNRSGKRQAWLYFVLAIALLLTTLSVGSAQASAAEGAGEVVPSVTILSSLPESNMVNYEMAIEVAEELQKLGVDATAQPVSYTHLDVYKRQLLTRPRDRDSGMVSRAGQHVAKRLFLTKCIPYQFSM